MSSAVRVSRLFEISAFSGLVGDIEVGIIKGSYVPHPAESVFHQPKTKRAVQDHRDKNTSSQFALFARDTS